MNEKNGQLNLRQKEQRNIFLSFPSLHCGHTVYFNPFRFSNFALISLKKCMMNKKWIINLIHLDRVILHHLLLLLLLVVVLHPEDVVKIRSLLKLEVLIVLRMSLFPHRNRLVEKAIAQLNRRISIYRRWISTRTMAKIVLLHFQLFHHPIHLIILNRQPNLDRLIVHPTTSQVENQLTTM